MPTTHLALVGTTASGKSSLALEVARRLGDVELVAVDSMQVYRGMDIGTAKPTREEQAEVAHHLIDLADPAEEFSAARFKLAAAAALAAIEGRGHRALLVAVTAYGSEEDRRRGFQAGFNHYFVKPVEWEEIRRLLPGGA